MTREEAREFLAEFLKDKPDFRESHPAEDEEVYRQMDMLAEAIDMAITALSSSEIPNSSDTISRQAAIDVAKQHWYKPDIAKALEELPSAQPAPRVKMELEQ